MTATPSPVKTPRAGGRLIGGDPLRGIACVGVVLFHVTAYTLFAVEGVGRPGDIDIASIIHHYHAVGLLLTMMGKGVWIFFVLSGYLIARPMVAAYCEGRRLPSFRRYAKNRVLRIVPAFWVALVLTLVILGTHGTGVARMLAVVFFLQTYADSPFAESIGQAWTLGAEVMFYLLVPLAAATAVWMTGSRWNREQRAVAVIVACGVIFVVSLGAGLVLGRDVFHLRWAPSILFAFTPGVALAAVEQIVPGRITDPAKAARTAMWIGWSGFALYAIAGLPGTPDGSGRPLVVVASGAIVGAILLAQWAGAGCWRVLDNRVAHWLGERSFSLYLVHLLVIQLLVHHVTNSSAWASVAWMQSLTMLISLVVAHVLFTCVEAPFLRRRAGSQQQPLPAEPAPADVAVSDHRPVTVPA